MKKLLPIIAITAAGLAPQKADAFLLNPYLGFSLGESTMNVDDTSLSSDFSYTGALGLQINVPLAPLRAEYEYMNLNSEKDGHELGLKGHAVNAYVGLPLMPIIKPYIGAGIATLKANGGDSKAAPQFMVGLDLDLPMMPVAGGVEYRYLKATFGDIDGDGDSDKISAHSVLAKIRVTLG